VDKRADVRLADLGFAQQQKLFDAVHQGDGRPPPVLDADDVLDDPEGMLRALCAALAIPFEAAMLSWPAGRRDSDGLWAAHWYGSVEQSTGFVASRAAPRRVPEHLSAVLEAAEPYYQALRPHRLKPLS
jgi:hypothetical protein